MNAFVEQFLIESRELVEQASADLLALEERPEAREPLEGAFRGFHTLKGAAGIMGFEPMVRVLHAAEDRLARPPGGEADAAVLVGECLATLDQVRRWLDAVEASGDLPADAEAMALGLLRRLGAARAPRPAPPTDGGWSAALQARHPAAAGAATHAARLAPDAQAFFAGLDPLAEVLSLEGLLALDIVAAGEAPALEALDPFACLIAFELLLNAAPDTLAQAWRAAGARVEVVALAAPPAAASGLPERAVELIEAQIRMLRAAGPDGRAGRTGSAARVAINVLRHAGRTALAGQVEAIASQGDPQDVETLAATLEQALAGSLEPPAAEAAAVSAPAPEAPEPVGEATAGATRSLRVDVARLDALVNLTGELLVAKNALGQTARLADAGSETRDLADRLRAQHAQLDRLVTDLQHAVLGVRVMPVRQVFQRFPRIVRELVATLGKPARLVTEGDATEADKTIVEGLFEPILHLIRNALDHGVETAAERTAAGKPPSATLTLRARREGDRVLIELEDDGRGLDLERIRAVAVERGVLDARSAAALDDAAAAQLVFAPGFSTARDVTDISGRGVGMDAVRAAIERLGGQVSLQSRPGRGALVRASLPFTIAMSRILTVETAGQMFGIPLEAVSQTLRLPRPEVREIGQAQAFLLRGRTLPLIDLAGLLRQPATRPAHDDLLVVVCQAAGQSLGLVVDRLGERLEVVLKPMEGLLAGASAIAGATLLGDGRVLLVLDLAELIG